MPLPLSPATPAHCYGAAPSSGPSALQEGLSQVQAHFDAVVAHPELYPRHVPLAVQQQRVHL